MKKNPVGVVVIVLILGILTLISYEIFFDNGYYTEVEQEVELASAIHCTYKVSTWLWVRGGGTFNYISEIENYYQDRNVKEGEIEFVKELQLTMILPFKAKVDAAIERKDCMPYKTEREIIKGD